MRKFLFFLIILLLLGGTVFFLGWTQYRLEKDSYGVVYTKTHGYFDQPLVSGEFSWSPWALIPGNMDIIPVPSSARTIKTSKTHELPQADVYKRMLTGSPDFSYEITIEIDYRLRREHTTEAVEQHGLTQESVYSWFLEKDNNVKETADAHLANYFQRESTKQSPENIPEQVSAYLDNKLTEYFPELEITDCRASFDSNPDIALYQEATQQYRELMERKQKILLQAIENEPDKLADHLLYIEQLEAYGELLTTYPILLDYLELAGTDP